MNKYYFIKTTAIVFCGLCLLFSSCEKKEEALDQASREKQYIAKDIEFTMQVDGKEWKAKSAQYIIPGGSMVTVEDGVEHGTYFFRIAAFNKKVDQQLEPINDSALEKIEIFFEIPYAGSPYSIPNFGKGNITLLEIPMIVQEIAQYQEKGNKLFLHNPETGPSPGKVTITKLVMIDPLDDSKDYDSSRIEGTFDLKLYPKDMPAVTTPKIITGKFSLKLDIWNLAD